MRTPFPVRAFLRRVLLILATTVPWLMWLDLNAMALRFVQLRGRWPQCPGTLPCPPQGYYRADDALKTLGSDSVHLHLDPTAWQEKTVLVSALVWMLLWPAVRKTQSPVARRRFIYAIVLAWLCLIFDPTGAVGWYLD